MAFWRYSTAIQQNTCYLGETLSWIEIPKRVSGVQERTNPWSIPIDQASKEEKDPARKLCRRDLLRKEKPQRL